MFEGRKLASVRKVGTVYPIEGADNIECATIDGWVVVVKKDSVKPEQLVVYFEIDSVLPEANAAFSFLGGRESAKEYPTDNGTKVQGWRLKTIKLRKQISQGLILPVDDFVELKGKNVKEGQCVTDLLGVEKYERPAERVNGNNSGSTAKGHKSAFPRYLIKSDQERIQNIASHIFKTSLGARWEISHKLDGSSATFSYHDGKFALCSRNLNLQLPKFYIHTTFAERLCEWFREALNNVKRVLKCTYRRKHKDNPVNDLQSSWHRAQDDYQLFDKLEWYNNYAKSHNLEVQNIAFQGEIIASNIQNNYEKLEEGELEFRIYAIQDSTNRKFLLPQDARDIIALINTEFDADPSRLSHRPNKMLVTVPIVNHSATFDEIGVTVYNEDGTLNSRDTLDKLLKYAEMKSIVGDKPHDVEGVVFKSTTDNGISFKVISNKYLLKNE